MLGRADASMPARVWILMAIGQLGPGIADRAHDGIMRSLTAESPTVRRAAIRTLGTLRDVEAIGAISALTSDTTLDPSAWFDDDCTVGQTAALVLEELQSPDKTRT
jgi:HEAT repeat protein